MSTLAPSQILELAKQNLPWEDALSALEDLPIDLFPALFKDSFTSRQTSMLKVMVAAWPFCCLPMGPVKKVSNLNTLKAVLDGLDLLISFHQRKARSRMWKLQVLDLRNVYFNFWNVQTGTQLSDCLPQFTITEQSVKDHSASTTKQCLMVLADFDILGPDLNEYDKCLLQWTQLRKGSVQLCCQKVQVWVPLPAHTITEMLMKLDPDRLQELELQVSLDLEDMAHFGPFLGELRNLRKLLLHGIKRNVNAEISPELEKKWMTIFLSQFSKLHSLQHLCMNDVFFLKGHLKMLLRCLKTPLETLSITHCQLPHLALT